MEPKEIGKYLREEEEQIAVRDRSGKECEYETNTLLVLFDGYCELLWKGMNHFGIVQEEVEYYTDYYYLNKNTVNSMKAVLEKKAEFKRI